MRTTEDILDAYWNEMEEEYPDALAFLAEVAESYGFLVDTNYLGNSAIEIVVKRNGRVLRSVYGE